MPERENTMPRIIPDQTRAPGGLREGPLSPRSPLWQWAGVEAGANFAAPSKRRPAELTDHRLHDRTTTITASSGHPTASASGHVPARPPARQRAAAARARHGRADG